MVLEVITTSFWRRDDSRCQGELTRFATVIKRSPPGLQNIRTDLIVAILHALGALTTTVASHHPVLFDRQQVAGAQRIMKVGVEGRSARRPTRTRMLRRRPETQSYRRSRYVGISGDVGGIPPGPQPAGGDRDRCFSKNSCPVCGDTATRCRWREADNRSDRLSAPTSRTPPRTGDAASWRSRCRRSCGLRRPPRTRRDR